MNTFLRQVSPVLLALVTATTASAAGLVNGSFESPVMDGWGSPYSTAPAGFGWTIASGEIDLLRTYWQPSDGYQSIDLSGWTATGSIYQDFAFPSSGSWTISFDLSANPDLFDRGDGLATGLRNMRVDFGTPGSMSELGIYGVDSAPRTINNMGWITITTPEVNVSDSLVYRLQFTALSPQNGGPALDNIRIAVVPEPGSAALFGAAAVGLLLWRRRKVG